MTMDEPPMASNDFARRLVERAYAADDVERKTRAIYDAVLSRSSGLTRGNF
jgi:hypothetical protein